MVVEPPQFGPDSGPAVDQRPAQRGTLAQSEASWEAVSAVSQVYSSALAMFTSQTQAQLAEMAQQQQRTQQMMMTAMEQLATRLGHLEVQANGQSTQQATAVPNHKIATPTEEASSSGNVECSRQ